MNGELKPSRPAVLAYRREHTALLLMSVSRRAVPAEGTCPAATTLTIIADSGGPTATRAKPLPCAEGLHLVPVKSGVVDVIFG